MSQEKVELARSMVGWFNTQDADSAQAHSTDDVEIVPLRAALEDTTTGGLKRLHPLGPTTTRPGRSFVLKPRHFVTPVIGWW
jgi:hypothetical protein